MGQPWGATWGAPPRCLEVCRSVRLFPGVVEAASFGSRRCTPPAAPPRGRHQRHSAGEETEPQKGDFVSLEPGFHPRGPCLHPAHLAALGVAPATAPLTLLPSLGGRGCFPGPTGSARRPQGWGP